jgi:hypothetical protein
MKPKTKVRQIVVRFDQDSYDEISEYAEKEHRGIGEFIRHAALEYIDCFKQIKERANAEGGNKT